MSFSEAIVSAFSQYATFSGRARRSEYWYFTLFNYLATAVLYVVGLALPILSWLPFVYFVATVVPGLAVSWRRLHDIGKSGGYYFVGLIPLIGEIILLVWFFTDSQPGSNKYGPCPKE
ncbi:MAG: DUF805 domain-containing protein [Clostridiales bacterium]|nr:DUF805 domain-containing protein [Clostridiales bacterium]